MSQCKIQTQDGLSSVTLMPESGGILRSIFLPDNQGQPREVLFLGDEFDAQRGWKHGGWPFCFPICGRLDLAGKSQYLYEGEPYEMGIHGFAYQFAWEVLEQADDRIALRLQHNAETLKQYPFEFEVILEYTIKPGELLCRQTYHNLGDKPMPFYAGFHPYFLINAAKEDVLFDCQPVRGLRYNDTLTDVIGELPLFPTPIALSDPALHDRLLEMGEDKRATLTFPDGFKLQLSVEGEETPDLFKFIQLYHQMDEAFFCIEPWMSHPNAMNTHGAPTWLAPSEKQHAQMKLSVPG